MASSNQSRKSLHLLPRSGAELSSLTGLRVSCMQTQALNMTRSAAVGVSKTGMKGNRTRRKLHLPGFGLRPARRTTPRTPELRVCFVFIGPQHEVIAAHSSRWPFGAELLEECKSRGTGQIAADHVTHGFFQVRPISATASTTSTKQGSAYSPRPWQKVKSQVQDVLRPIGFAD